MLTNIKDGWQMVHAMNTLKIDAACYGNHEFDFESKHTLKLAKACNFPWLLGNISYIVGDKLLGDGEPYLVKEHNGLRIGIMGVAGADWIGVLN
jgi:5'-nucleotidase